MNHPVEHSPTLTDTHQSLWQITSIQLAGWISLPILATSILVLENNSFMGAVLTIILANAILWFIRLGIIAMSYKNRQSTLDISYDYLGVCGKFCIAILLLVSTQIWFVTQTTAASSALTHLIILEENPSVNQFIQVSVLLGILSSFLCMNGIVILRKLCTYAFPLIIAAFFIIIFKLPEVPIAENNNPMSFAGLALVLATNLGMTSDLPTFFRHSQSLYVSIKALTVIQIISLFLGLFSLYFYSIVNHHFEVNDQLIWATGDESLRIALIVFIFLSVLCANVANVYSASVGWEWIAPKALVGRKEYLILGLGLTTVFILISNIFSLEFALSISDGSLVNLCLVLILGFVINRQYQRLPNLFEQGIYFAAWLLATILNILQFSEVIFFEESSLLVSVVCIVAVIFLGFLARRCLPIFFRKRSF